MAFIFIDFVIFYLSNMKSKVITLNNEIKYFQSYGYLLVNAILFQVLKYLRHYSFLRFNYIIKLCCISLGDMTKIDVFRNDKERGCFLNH